MLFVQSLRGLSHTKLEDTKEEHLELAVQALDRLATKTIAWVTSPVTDAPTLLTFGARNLGRTLACRLTGDGWDVSAVARSQETVEALADELPGALGIVGDAGDPDDVESAFAATRQRFGEIDLVVNAITASPRGSFGGGTLAEAPPDAMEPYVDGLLPGIFNVMRVGTRILGEQGRGTLVQVTGGSTPGGASAAAAPGRPPRSLRVH